MRPILTIAAATLAAAIPTTALAATSGDDPATRATTTASTSTTRVVTERVTAAQRPRAIAAARKAVPAGARVTKVERDRHTGDRTVYEVELRTSSTEYEVHLDRRFGVVEVERDRLGDDDDSSSSGRDRDHAEDD